MYEDKTVIEILSELKTNRVQGLSRREAHRRIERDGPNQLKEQEQKHLSQMILGQLNDPLILVLVVAMAISVLLGEIGDAIIIVVVVFLNATVGIVQEGKAGRAVEALKKISSPKAVVVRDGERQRIEAREIVCGDIIVLEAGNRVPADCRLVETQGMFAEESTLTGESVPVEKHSDFIEGIGSELKECGVNDNSCPNMVYMSTYVTKGKGVGVAVATGMDTKIGHIADMLNTEDKLTPLQVKLGELGKLLSVLAIAICVFLFAVAVLQKRDVGEMLLTSVSLSVAAVPEGLPAIVTIVLALCVSRMVKANTIVRKLSAVETLGAVEVVCSDKTGTLTQNRMTVSECYLDGKKIGANRFDTIGKGAEGKEQYKHFLMATVLCNDSILTEESEMGDPTETALLHMADKCGMRIEKIRNTYRRVDEIGFDSIRKRMTTFHIVDGQKIAYSKGAAERIIADCDRIYCDGKVRHMTSEERSHLAAVQKEFMDQGKRVLAFSMANAESGNQEKKMIFLGLVSMLDPVRPETVLAVEDFKKAGVTTVMITGDHPDTAFSIARELGIANRQEECINGRELDCLSDRAFLNRLPSLRVFSRVTPEHKVRIVEGFKALGKTVAMTGDGVNDAPSLQAADIGIAMGMNGTDVARGAADFVLMDDNFATIHMAIKEGRGIYENIRKSVLFLLSSNLGEIITMLVAIVAGLPTPLKASYILWINLITDSLPALALGVDDNETARLMREKPRAKNQSLFAKGGLLCVICYGLVIGGVALAAFLKVPFDWVRVKNLPVSLHNIVAGLRVASVLEKAQTHAFMVLGISQLFHAVGMRDVDCSVFKMNHRKNLYMVGAVFAGILLQISVTELSPLISLFGTTKLTFMEWGQLIALSLTPLIVHELLVAVGKKKEQPEKEML